MENLNVNDYTTQELLDILDITSLDMNEINVKTSSYIQKFTEEGNEDMAEFFRNVKKALNKEKRETTVEDWFENQYPLTPDQPIQNSKITSRLNKVQEFDGVLNRERLAINQSHPLPFAQGEINPTLRNITTKIVSIDSQFRNNNIPALKSLPYSTSGIWNPSHFTADLSEPLRQVMTLRLYSIQIPYTWYNIPEGSNCFMYNDEIKQIPPGNYSIDTLKTAIDIEGGGDFSLDISQYSTTGKVSISIDTPPITDIQIRFYQTAGFSQVGCENCFSNNHINNTLGWLLGFREPCYTITPLTTSVAAEAIIDLIGPKYFLLYLDEFNMNRVNKGLVNIQDTETKLDLPEYYKTGNFSTANNLLEVNEPECQNDQLVIGNDECGIRENYPIKVPFYTQDLPRNITQAQQYSLNEIIKNRKNSPNIKLTAPNPNNIFGMIPVKNQNLDFGELLVENANSLTFNTRRYFGPVDIERIEVKLLDDKGNLVQLNGGEWSFSFFADQLYQY